MQPSSVEHRSPSCSISPETYISSPGEKEKKMLSTPPSSILKYFSNTSTSRHCEDLRAASPPIHLIKNCSKLNRANLYLCSFHFEQKTNQHLNWVSLKQQYFSEEGNLNLSFTQNSGRPFNLYIIK